MQITLANSDLGSIDFTGSPPLSLYVASPGLSGAAYFGSDVGGYTFGPFVPTLAGPLVGGNFATAIDQTFAYSAPDGDALNGIVHWTLVKDNSPNPDMIGDLSIASVSGDPEFTGAFSPGGTAHIDIVLAFKYPSAFLDDTAGTTGTTSTAISAGEGVPQPNSVSEPMTLAIFGIAMIAAAWSRRGKSAFTGRREVV